MNDIQAIHAHSNAALVRAACAREASRSDAEAREAYDSILTKELAWEGLYSPVPMPITNGSPKTLTWVDPRRVKVEAARIYHHTHEEMVQFAVEKRGEADTHLNHMDDLHVGAYPTPGDGDPILAIGQNGNHRSFIFRMLGFTMVAGHLNPCAPDRWRVTKPQAIKAHFFEFLGLATVEEAEGHSALVLHDPTRCVGWVLPPENTAPRRIPAEIVRRLERLEQVTGHIDDPRVEILRDKRRLFAALREFKMQSADLPIMKAWYCCTLR